MRERAIFTTFGLRRSQFSVETTAIFEANRKLILAALQARELNL
jgi:hypothetical protein